MARKDKKKRSGKERVSQQQLQAYRARQEAVRAREEVEARRDEERRRQLQREEEAARRAEEDYADVLGTRRDEPEEEVSKLTPEQIAADYQAVRIELSRIAIWGGLSFALLAIAAIYMNM